jgi:hypothetical protein
MKRLVVVPIVALALLAPGSAAAKGPSEAKIMGPGLKAPVTITGVGEGDTSTALGVLVAEGGFFPQAFGQSPDPTQRKAPDRLGPRYVVTYTVPGPALSTLEQELYPYAAGGPVTYMRPGQALWDQSTRGGWYRGTVRLKQMLVKAGLPKSTVSTRGRAAISRKKTIAIGAGAGVALAAAVLALYRRRR